MTQLASKPARTLAHRLTLVFASAGLVMVASGAAGAQNSLELRRVILSTGGVGYFEHEATVEGSVQLPLTVRLDQVDDVLKSLVIYDNRGGIGTISLPGREPLRETFRELPFKADALESAAALLRALPGARIKVSGPRPLEGSVLGVTAEETTSATGARVTRHRVSVLTADQTVRQFLLEETEQVEFADPTLRAQMAGALTAIARNRVQERRTLTLSLKGSGRRTVRIGYVVEVPLWKTSYRLTIQEAPASSAASGGKGLLQAWAIVENLSGTEWNGVDLTLVSGNPVTLRQALYRPHYVQRPEVPVEMMGRVVPRVDTGAAAQFVPRPLAKPAPARKPAPKPKLAPRAAPAEALAAPALEAATEEAATQVLFRVPEPVRLASGSSLAIPIANREITTDRVSLWDGTSGSVHPLAAVRLRNETDSSLPPGLLSIFERGRRGQHSYVGDARLGWFPAAESRLVSFAVDLKTQVVSDVSQGQRIATGRISRGVLQLEIFDRYTTRYQVKAPAQEARAVLIEHRRLAGWRLASPADGDVEQTQAAFRLRARVGAGETKEVVVVQERPTESRFTLVDGAYETLLALARNTELSDRVRRALESVAALRQAVAKEEEALAAVEAKRTGIVKEQERIRQNLARVPPSSDLHKRYLDMLRQQEDQMEALAAQISEARSKVGAARGRLSDAIEGIEL